MTTAPRMLCALVGRWFPRGACGLLASPALLGRALLIVAFAVTKIAALAGREPILTGDGRIWGRVAGESLFSAKFWTGSRPPTLSLVYKLIGLEDQRLVWFQCSLAIACWGLFAAEVSALVVPAVASLGVCALVLALGLTTPVHGWDLVVRSESVGISLFVAGLGALLHVARGTAPGRLRNGAWLALAVAAAALAAFARETTAYTLPLAGALGVGLAWAWHEASTGRLVRDVRCRRALGLALALVLVSLTSQAVTRASGRYGFPLMNVIFQRVLPDRQKLAYFEQTLGMPVSDALLARKRRWASSDERIAFHAPELAPFRKWLLSQGYAGYQRYLLAHLARTLGEANAYFPRSAAESYPRLARRVVGVASAVPDAVLVRGPHSRYPRLALTLSAALAAGAVWLGRRGARALGLLSLYFVACALTQAYICFHADAMELDRHALLVGVTFRMAVLFAPLAAIAVWLERRSPKG